MLYSCAVRDAVSYHDSIASNWEAGYKSSTFSVRLDLLASLIPPDKPKQRWLDVGCGTGTLSNWLVRERGFSVVAIDASEQMLRNAIPHPRIEYRKGDAANSGLSDASFDGIICSSVLEFLPSVEAALEEFRRVLKPGGTLIVSVPNSALSVRIPLKTIYWLSWPFGRKRWYRFLEHSKRCYSTETLFEELQNSMFSVQRMIRFGVLELPFGLRLPTAGTLIMALAKKT